MSIAEWLIKLLPFLLDVFHAKGHEAKTIAASKLAAEAAHAQNDHDLANKRYPESPL